MNDYLRTRFENLGERDNTFVYLFTHKGAASFTEIFKGGDRFYGTSHAEELQYIFPIREDLPYFFNSVPTKQDLEVTKIMTKLWVNFAYYGNPTPNNSEFISWKTAKEFPLNYMRIGNKNGEVKEGNDLMSMEKDLYPERTEFWRVMAEKTHYPKIMNKRKDEL